jgi:putative membrane protein
MRKGFIYIILGCVLLSSCKSSAEKKSAAMLYKQQNAEKIKEADVFLTEVATGVYREVEISRLALQKASLTKVREFARNMISDYDKNIKGLQDLANRKNITLSLYGDAVLKEQLNILTKLEGIAFDREYIKMMVEDHIEDVRKFKIQGEHGKDIETKAFASGKLTILRHHLDMARTLHDSMEKS